MKIAVMGFGTVGSGVVEVINKNNVMISRNSMQDSLEIKYILDIRDFPDSPYRDLIVKDFNVILNDPDVEIVVETMGGVTFAYDFVKRLLLAGKSVVTSNKELVAKHGYELMSIARDSNINFLFEASVGGGIPIISPIHRCLSANELTEVAGILNGTTNYILTKMFSDGTGFDEALKTAQELGYAERDPSADVDGFDACRKICILATLCFGKQVDENDIETKGIRGITLADTEYARDWGGAIKLIGAAKKISDEKISIWVSPALVNKHSQLASVEDVFNAILVRGDALGDVVFYGRGAGKLPTASAVVADVIDAAKHTARRINLQWDPPVDGYVTPNSELTHPMYVRGVSGNKYSVLAKIEKDLGGVRALHRTDAPDHELAFAIKPVREDSFFEYLKNELPDFEVQTALRITDY